MRKPCYDTVGEKKMGTHSTVIGEQLKNDVQILIFKIHNVKHSDNDD